MVRGWIFIFCLGLIYVSQLQTDLDIVRASQHSPATENQAITLQNGRVLDAGFHRAAADILWLTTIQYFGTPQPTQEYPSLYPMLRAVTTTDPQFAEPYLSGGIVLPWQGQPNEALSLLQDGWEQFPDNGLFPYNAGAVAKLQLHDASLAAHYFTAASKLPNTPPAAAILAGVNLTELSDRDFALTWWDSVIETTTNPVIKERAQLWREHLVLVITLEEQITEAQQTGRPLPVLPDSPLGVPLRFNPDTNQVELVR